MSGEVTIEKDQDLGFAHVVREYAALQGLDVTIGVHQEEKQRSDTTLTNVQIATFHEFGTDNAPERSFLRATADEEQDRILDWAEDEVAAVISGRCSAQVAGDRVAMLVEGAVKERISKGIDPPLSAYTIKQKTTKGGKRGTTPLIDTSSLYNAICGKARVGSAP